MAIANENDARIIRSNDDLLEAVLQSPQRLEDHLHGESPAVHELWNHPRRKNESTPKDEEDISDSVKRWLDRDLVDRAILANREVVNHPGDETDIYIQASGREAGDIFTVVIEVKGCWNRELPIAMQDQLHDRYLSGQGHTHGIYLVGFFDRDSWNHEDFQSRHRASKNHTLDGLRNHFSIQAESLSKGDITIRALVLNARLSAASTNQGEAGSS